MEIKILANISIVAVFLVTFHMIKFKHKLELTHANQGEKEVSTIFQLNFSMTSIPTAISCFTMLKITAKRIRKQCILSFSGFPSVPNDSIIALVLRQWVLFRFSFTETKTLSISSLVSKLSIDKKVNNNYCTFSLWSDRNATFEIPEEVFKGMGKMHRLV